MIYKLLALNIDGSLLRSNMKMSKKTKDAIEYVKSKGVYVTLATARPFISARRIAKSLKLNGYLITNNGAYIAESLDEPLYTSRLQAEVAQQIVAILEQFNAHIRVQQEGYSISNKVGQKKSFARKGDSRRNGTAFQSHIIRRFIVSAYGR